MRNKKNFANGLDKWGHNTTCKWNEIYYTWRPNLKDEDDNFVVELAIASGSKAIITYNIKDFKNAELLFKHTIMTPEDFIEEIL